MSLAAISYTIYKYYIMIFKKWCYFLLSSIEFFHGTHVLQGGKTGGDSILIWWGGMCN